MGTISPHVPRVSASSVEMGQHVVFTLPTEGSHSITHTLTFTFVRPDVGTIATKSSSETIDWTTPNLASWIPNAPSANAVITCETFLDNVSQGTTTVRVELKVPAAVVPGISGFSAADTASAIVSKFGGSVQNRSKVHVAATLAGASGSTVKKWTVMFDGRTYSDTTSSVSFDTDVITGSGDLTLKLTVTDSRGRTNSRTQTFTVIPYSAPKISIFKAERCNASGATDVSGTSVKYSATAEGSSGGGHNTMTAKLEWKKTTGSYVAGNSLALTVTNFAVSALNVRIVKTGADVFDATASYNLRLSVTDYFGTVQSEITVPTIKVLMDFMPDGTGIAFGKVAEASNKIELGMATVAFGNITIEKDNPYLTFENTQTGGGEHFFHNWANGGNNFGLYDGNLESHVIKEDPDGTIHFPVKPLGIGDGGTGATTAAAALTNLGAASADHVQDVAHGGTGATSASAARDALQVAQAVPHTSPAAGKIMVTGNTGGFGTSDAANKFWYLWDWKDGDIYPCSLHPGSNGVQSLGHSSYRIKTVYANNYDGIASYESSAVAQNSTGTYGNCTSGLVQVAPGHSYDVTCNLGKTFSAAPAFYIQPVLSTDSGADTTAKITTLARSSSTNGTLVCRFFNVHSVDVQFRFRVLVIGH